MPQEIKKFLSRQKKQLSDIRNVVLYIFAVVVLAVTWSTVKAIQSNYDLQKEISALNQQNAVLQLQNQNTTLKNKYFSTDAYLDLAARQNLGLAGPGEKVLLVPKTVALKYVDTSIIGQTKVSAEPLDTRSKYVKNLEDWRDFLLGRKIVEH